MKIIKICDNKVVSDITDRDMREFKIALQIMKSIFLVDERELCRFEKNIFYLQDELDRHPAMTFIVPGIEINKNFEIEILAELMLGVIKRRSFHI